LGQSFRAPGSLAAPGMRALGLRPQLLVLLGGLLVLAFVPLQLALSTYTAVTLRQLDDGRAHALGHALAAHVRELESSLSAPELIGELARIADGTTLVAARATLDGGEPATLGDGSTLEALAAAARSDEPAPRMLRAGDRRLWVVGVPSVRGSTWLALDADRSSARGRGLTGMFGLYAFLIGVSLLTVAYFALTRLIVRPLDELSRAAENVSLGKLELPTPSSSVRELRDLGQSLGRMTERLIEEERALRAKIAEVEHARADLARTQTQLVRSERLASVGRLAAGLAHEIGNPIAAMMGLEDLLLEGDLSPHEQRDFIKRMRAETERVHRTLKDLLQFARPRRDPRADGPESGDVEAAIHDTAALVVHQPSLQRLELHLDVEPALARVTLGTEQLGQVVLNLILNAADALSPGGAGRIRVLARAAADGVEIAVEDSGPGVPADVAEHIFEPFFTTKEVGKGTGLGLSVCQGLVSAAGGTLALDATYTAGARFVVCLPIAEPAEPAEPVEPAEPAA
jgi:two-component system, NtrC family, sensor kinase